jgi:membrane protease YdiL (CAAX protease family)
MTFGSGTASRQLDMNPAQIFEDRDGRLRAGWRLLLFVLLFAVGLILFQASAFGFIRHTASQLVHLVASTAAFLAAVCVATWLMMFLVEHQPFSGIGLRAGSGSISELSLGLTGGVSLVGAITAIEWASGSIHFELTGELAGDAVKMIVRAAGIFALGATTEELLFRGYAFQRLAEGTNGYFAAVATSIVFGLLHRANPHATTLSVANTMLAGVLLSLGYLKTRALWLPIGFHFSWNWSLALAGLPVSGLDLGNMPWQAMPTATHTWINGGAYGPEGGVAATVGLSAGIVYLLRMKQTILRPPESEGSLRVHNEALPESLPPMS